MAVHFVWGEDQVSSILTTRIVLVIMKKIIWFTDPHFEFLDNGIKQFTDIVLKEEPDSIFISGDISTSRSLPGEDTVLRQTLTQLSEAAPNQRIYFVFGKILHIFLSFF